MTQNNNLVQQTCTFCGLRPLRLPVFVTVATNAAHKNNVIEPRQKSIWPPSLRAV